MWSRLVGTWDRFLAESRKRWWAYPVVIIIVAIFQDKLSMAADSVVAQVKASGLAADMVRSLIGPVGALALVVALLIIIAYFDTRRSPEQPMPDRPSLAPPPPLVSPELYDQQQTSLEHERERNRKLEGFLDNLIARSQNGRAVVEGIASDSEEHTLRVSESEAPPPVTGSGEIVVSQPRIDAVGTTEVPYIADEPPSQREQLIGRADRLRDEGQFLLDRIRAGRDEYKDHTDGWMADVDRFFAEAGEPTEPDVSLNVLPFGNGDFPEWVRPVSAEIDRRLLLLRGYVNRRYARVVVTPGTAHLKITAYNPKVIVTSNPPQENTLGLSGSLEAVVIPGAGGRTLHQVSYETKGRRHFAFDRWLRRPKAIRFSKPEDRLIRAADLPVELACGSGRLVVEKFYDKGVVIDEDGTSGDPVAFVGYFDDDAYAAVTPSTGGRE